ncbi:MAG: class I SAM-dependent methyltransferase [Chloroflexota bacterium]
MKNKDDSWLSGNPYERFMGRWSRLIADKFLNWLAVPPASYWLDVGCGTGALTQQILHDSQARKIVGVDSSIDFVKFAKQSILDPTVDFREGLAQSLDMSSDTFDSAVSGLVLNFVEQPEDVLSEMIRVTKPGGKIGIFLWDYADGMEMLRYFWDAAAALDRDAAALDEGLRFPLCQAGELEGLIRNSALKEIEAVPIEVTSVFKNFDDYWQPFLGKVGPAPSYAMSLDPENRLKLESRLRKNLPISDDGSISLNTRAWAVKGTV